MLPAHLGQIAVAPFRERLLLYVYSFVLQLLDAIALEIEGLVLDILICHMRGCLAVDWGWSVLVWRNGRLGIAVRAPVPHVGGPTIPVGVWVVLVMVRHSCRWKTSVGV